MLRNDLVTYLGEQSNDTVTVDINGILIDVDSVTLATDRGSIVLALDPDDLRSSLERDTGSTSTSNQRSDA